jgi:hypothetical protein
MFRLICSGIAILLIVSGCSSEAPTRHNDFVPLTSIEIVAVAPAIAAKTSTKLTVIGNFSGQFTRDVTDQAVWASDAPTVAGFITPSSPSRVSGLAPGTAVLTATVGSVSAPFNLTVTSATVTAMTITPAAPTVSAGLTTQFQVSGKFTDATTQDLTFDATWASSAPDVATVSDAADSKGLAKALAAGTSSIIATFEGVSATALMTVTEVVLQSITVSPANPSILSLSTGAFTAAGNFSDGSTADLTSQVAWSSSQTDIATIASDGTASTLVPGTTTISATLNGISGTSNLKVTGGRLTGIHLSPANPSLVKDTVGPITATGSFNNGSSRDISGVVSWSVASPTVATVTTPGGNVALITALAATPATRVTATSGVLSADTNLTVTAPALRSLNPISPTSLDLPVGTSGRLTLTAVFNNGSSQDVTASADWTSNAVTTASVDNTGLAKGRVHGISAAASPVTITAAYGGLTMTTTVTVKAQTVATLAVSNSPATTLVAGNQVPFTATATFTDGTTRDVTEDATWTIDNTNVATFADSRNQPGQVVGVDSGSTKLTASFRGKAQTVTLTVP